jgi:hypothetical protein
VGALCGQPVYRPGPCRGSKLEASKLCSSAPYARPHGVIKRGRRCGRLEAGVWAEDGASTNLTCQLIGWCRSRMALWRRRMPSIYCRISRFIASFRAWDSMIAIGSSGYSCSGQSYRFVIHLLRTPHSSVVNTNQSLLPSNLRFGLPLPSLLQSFFIFPDLTCVRKGRAFLITALAFLAGQQSERFLQ